MSFNKFKATIHKLTELPWEDFKNLFTWPSCGSTLQADNANLLVAKVTSQNGEAVAYVTAEPILLVDSYVLNTQRTPSDDEQAGEEIDTALAQRAGVNRLWVVIPNGAPPMKGEKCIRVFERKAPQPINHSQSSDSCYVEQRSAYLN